jgi:hypothetical protein
MRDIIGALRKARVKPKERAKIYNILIPAFEGHDCDTLQECASDDPMFAQVYDKLNPSYEYYDVDEIDY